MIRNKLLVTAVGTALVGAAAMFSATASAGGNVAWSVSVGGPGFAVSAGRPVAAPYYRPYYRPWVRPAPVVYRPYYYPPPRRVVVAPPPVVYPAPYYSQPVVIAPY